MSPDHKHPADTIPAVYERHADAWAHARLLESTLYEQPWLDRFCALLPTPASLLDCGCGPGEPIARYLTHRGHALLGIDASPAMIRKFHALLPTQRAAVADMRTLALPETFHGILAWDSFFHLSPLAQRAMFQTFRHHAAPRAALLFTSGPAHGEVLGQLEGDPLYHASLAPSEYRQLLEQQGFAILHHHPADPTCHGRSVWLAQLQ